MSLNKLTVIAKSVHPDEPCYGLAEMTLTKPDYHGRCRYQIVYVNRNDRITPFLRDVTDEVGGNLDYPPLRIVSYGDDTVGQLWSLADEYRINRELEQKIAERKGTSTLLKNVLELSQILKKVEYNRTVFGSGSTTATTQRNGFHVRRTNK